jgi:hypothetical protein
MAVSEHREGFEVEVRPSDSAVLHELDVVRGREALLKEQVALLEERLLEAETRVTEMEREVDRYAAQVGEMKRTLSWRITAPLRAVRRLRPRS